LRTDHDSHLLRTGINAEKRRGFSQKAATG